jgi:5-methylcytosine-specific restriction endonuclease McrA
MLASCASRGGGRRLRMASARDRIADFWDELTAAWLAGEDPLPDPLPRWYASYEGRGDGRVTRDAFAEPYVGDLRGTPRMVILGLNPGRACPEFQARNGIFAREIRERGSYSAWAAPVPYLGEEWSLVNGRNRYAWSRLRFARDWLEDKEVAPQELLTLELYPWHSTRVTASIAPPAEIIEAFIWQPLADIPVELVFAFGKPWLGVCDALGLPEVGRWGRGGVDLGSPVASRAAVAFALPSGQWVVVSWQSGYAGPPGSEDALRLRERLLEARDGMRRDSRPDPQGLLATPQRQRRKYTVSQAKNRMRRTVEEILDPGPRNVDALWEHFGAQCAYCGKGLSRDRREGHVDHADPDGGNDLGNLVLACGSCNGDEKREESWHEFLRRKTPDDILFAEREGRIRAWLDQHPRKSAEDSPEIAHVREEFEGLIQQFAVKCAELKRLVSQRDSAP